MNYCFIIFLRSLLFLLGWCAFSGGPEDDGVAIFAPDGVMIGRILLPERCANVAFGGRKRNRLFMTASQSVYALYVEAQGCPGG